MFSVKVFVPIPRSSPLASEVEKHLLVHQDINENYYWGSDGISASLVLESIEHMPKQIGKVMVQIRSVDE